MDSKTICFKTGKGGSGKTTGSVTLFGCLLLANKKVALVDMDDDKADSYKWATRSKIMASHAYQIHESNYSKYKEKINDLRRSYEYIIIDTAPVQTTSYPYGQLFAIKQSDLVIIPVMAGESEVRAAENAKSICDMESKAYKILFSKWTETTNVSKRTQSNFDESEYFSNHIKSSTKYGESEAAGEHILERLANVEIENNLNALTDEVITYLK